MDKPFDNIAIYPIIPENPDIFSNNTTLECITLGWGKTKFEYPTYRANFASVWVKYGPDACRVPPDKYIYILTLKNIRKNKISISSVFLVTL